MADHFSKFTTHLDSPFQGAYAITTGSSALPTVTRGIYVGTTGNVAVQMLGYGIGNTSNLASTDYTGNTIVTFIAVPAGAVLPIRATYVYANTTANNLIALY